MRTTQVVILGGLGSSEMTDPESPAAHGLDSWGMGPSGCLLAGRGLKMERDTEMGGRDPGMRARDTELGEAETQRWGDRTRETWKQICRDEEREIQSWRNKDAEMEAQGQ